MTVPVPTSEPQQFVAGDSVLWSRTLASYPSADGWTLAYRLVGPSVLVSQPVVTVDDSGTYQVALAAAATAATDFVADSYRLLGWVQSGTERHTIIDTMVDVWPNVAVLSYSALQTHAERMLAAVEARLEGRVTADVSRYGREGAFVEKIPFENLLHTRGVYSAMVDQQRRGGSSPRIHHIVFGQAGRR